MIHELKCWPMYFQSLYIGEKEFEVRKNDRDFKVGDSLYLREYNIAIPRYTGRTMMKRVTYLIQGICGLPPDICIMQLR